MLAGDVAGTVVETGAAVTRFHVGDKITSHLYSKWLDGPIGLNSGDTLYGGSLPGGLAEYMLLNEQSAVRAPSYLLRRRSVDASYCRTDRVVCSYQCKRTDRFHFGLRSIVS
jgi:NADPH:quinone reductase-like Zn-dependent oxidoreductase